MSGFNLIFKVFFLIIYPLLGVGYGASLDELLAVSKGDMASLQINHYAQAAWQVSLLQYDLFIYSFYDRNDSVIVVELYGTKERPDDAQKAMEHFRSLLRSEFITFFKKNYGIEIDEIKDLKLIYRNRSEEGRRVIYLWEKGKYRFPIK